jgi:hypothetical protein
MTVSVVQNKGAAGIGPGNPFTVNFTSAATIGNSIIVWVGDYNSGSNVISSSAPTYNGGSVTGATKLTDVQNSGNANVMYFAVWLLPNVQSSGTAVVVSTSNGSSDSNAHCYIAEVSGLGASPALDSASSNPKTASGSAGGTLTSGATGNAVGSSGIVLGGMMQDGNATGWTPPAGWTNIQAASSYAGASYQIFTSSGSSYTWSATGTSAGQWAAGAVILDASGGGGGSPAPSLLMASFP